jgi:hypothetical protein
VTAGAGCVGAAIAVSVRPRGGVRGGGVGVPAAAGISVVIGTAASGSSMGVTTRGGGNGIASGGPSATVWGRALEQAPAPHAAATTRSSDTRVALVA